MSFGLLLGIYTPATPPVSQDALSRERSVPVWAPALDRRSSSHRAGTAPRYALVASAALHGSIITVALMWPMSVSRMAIEPSPVAVRLLVVEPDTEVTATPPLQWQRRTNLSHRPRSKRRTRLGRRRSSPLSQRRRHRRRNRKRVPPLNRRTIPSRDVQTPHENHPRSPNLLRSQSPRRSVVFLIKGAISLS